MAADLSEHLLHYLDEHESFNSLNLAEKLGEDHQRIVGAIKSLQSLGNVIEAEQESGKQWELTEEGKEVVEHGSHEARVFHAIPPQGIPQQKLLKEVPNSKIGFSKAMSLGWVKLEKGGGESMVVRKTESIVDDVAEALRNVLNLQVDAVSNQQKQELKKRKLLQEVVVKMYQVKKGQDFTCTVRKQETELTAEMISSGSWKTLNLKPYNFNALGAPLTKGHLHPLMKVRAEFRQIFLEMGFTEMPTNNYVESSFWNFDTLFQPQQHPSRDAQDTFFVSDPEEAGGIPEEYMERVKTVHSHGAYGSLGYQCPWSEGEARKNVLRTHTTAVSARMLYALAKNGFKPAKYFSIDKVFRNESLDATHLAEFCQIEGVVAEYGMSLASLIGVIKEFFKKLGMEELRFKPTSNPYTEPSMEVFCYHKGLKKWVEVGNSGLFRAEMLRPMGLPDDVGVLGWGLSLERPTMIKYGINNIRDLVGPKVNLQMIYDNPICRLEKHQ